MIYLTIDIVKKIHNKILKEHGGLEGIRDKNLLNSSIEQIKQSYGGEELYPTLEEKAARLCFSIIRNHPFSDGNKRTGMLSMLLFLRTNNVQLRTESKDDYKFFMDVAASKKDYKDIIKWIKDNKI